MVKRSHSEAHQSGEYRFKTSSKKCFQPSNTINVLLLCWLSHSSPYFPRAFHWELSGIPDWNRNNPTPLLEYSVSFRSGNSAGNASVSTRQGLSHPRGYMRCFSDRLVGSRVGSWNGTGWRAFWPHVESPSCQQTRAWEPQLSKGSFQMSELMVSTRGSCRLSRRSLKLGCQRLGIPAKSSPWPESII